jgi:hypothetical protein
MVICAVTQRLYVLTYCIAAMVNLSPNVGTFFGVCGVQLLAALAGEAMGVFIGKREGLIPI